MLRLVVLLQHAFVKRDIVATLRTALETFEWISKDFNRTRTRRRQLHLAGPSPQHAAVLLDDSTSPLSGKRIILPEMRVQILDRRSVLPTYKNFEVP